MKILLYIDHGQILSINDHGPYKNFRISAKKATCPMSFLQYELVKICFTDCYFQAWHGVLLGKIQATFSSQYRPISTALKM